MEGDRQRSYNEVRQVFNEIFRDENTAISRSTVERTIRRFDEIGSMKNRQIPERPISATSEVQELNKDDFDRRMEFCELIMRKIDDDSNFLFNIVLSDEATF